MLETLSGATRLHVILGDPIAQVKSPAGLTRSFAARGHDAVVVPLHVGSAEIDAVVAGLSSVRNLDGIIATVPHKFALYAHCATASPRAHLLRSVNILRRAGAGGWHGDMLDGLGFVAAQRAAGCDPAGRRALLVGAGGAGSAIGLALLEAGVAELAIHDADPVRRDALRARLAGSGLVTIGSDDPAGFDLVANATPSGMRPGDPPPIRLDRLAPGMCVGDVVTMPEITPLLAAAHAIGCRAATGLDMFDASLAPMTDFLLGSG